jgi:hypothetical protein
MTPQRRRELLAGGAPRPVAAAHLYQLVVVFVFLFGELIFRQLVSTEELCLYTVALASSGWCTGAGA